jgi:O-antigen/teichoic acid export membrane protein
VPADRGKLVVRLLLVRPRTTDKADEPMSPSRVVSDQSVASPFADSVEKTGARVLRSSAWQIGAQVAPFATTLVVSIVAARALGPDGMGRQSYISFILLTTMMACSAGFSATLPRYVGELIGQGEEGKLQTLATWSWQLALVAGALGAGILVVIAALGATPQLAWVFASVAAFTGILHKVPASILNGAQRWRQNSIVILGTAAATGIATVVALLLGGGITSIFVCTAAGNTVLLLLTRGLSRRLLSRIRAVRVPLGHLRIEVLRFAAVASVPMLLNFVVFQRSEFYFLERSSTNTQIALYSIAYSVYAALLAFPTGFVQMFAPAVATLKGAGAHERIRNGYARSLRLIFLITIPITAAAIVFGPPLVQLVYGDQYAGAGVLIRVLAIPLLIVPAGGVSGGLLFGYGRIRVPVLVGIVAGTVDLGLAALLVPHLDALGAAFANISAQLIAGLLGIGYCVRMVGGIQTAPRHLAKTVAAALVAGGCAELVLLVGSGAGFLALAMLVGIAVYAALAASLRVLPREDADWLVQTLGGRAKGRLTRVCKRLSGAPLGAI